MAHQIRMWKVTSESMPTEIPRNEISLEKRLHDWLETDISMLDPNLLVIGREVQTDFGGRIDLLCLDSSGGLVVVELKKGKTPREVTAQVLDYAYWVRDLTYDDIIALSRNYPKIGMPLPEAFARHFGDELPDALNENHRSVIVAEEMDESTERIVRYLSDLDVPINIATVQHFRAEDGSELIAQVYLIEPEVAADKAQAASRKTAYMSVSERLALAEENGVGDLYRRIRDIERSSSSKLFTNSAGRGKVSLTARVKGRSLTILVMELGQSDQASGLRFRLNATRLIEHFELNLEEIQQGLPTSAEPLTPSEWHGAAINTTADWQGFKGNFRSVEEIDNFMAMLQPRTRCT